MKLTAATRLAAGCTAAVALAIPFASSTALASTAPSPRLAATHSFIVTSLADEDATNPSSGHCVAANGRCTLRAAVEVANSLDVPVKVTLPAGTITLSLGAIYVLDPAGVSVTGKSSSASVIAGAGDRVFVVTSTTWFGGTGREGSSLTLANLAIVNGSAPASSPLANQGGGIAIPDSNDSLVATNVKFQNNRAPATGSGVGGAVGVEGAALFTQCTFVGNQAGLDGGAIFTHDGILVVNGSAFSSNTANAGPGGTGVGGAIDIDSAAWLTNSTFTNNTAAGGSSSGGAVHTGETTTIVGDRFAGNHATASSPSGFALGGALFAGYGPSPVIGSTFLNNQADGAFGYGGAVYATAPVNVEGSHFTGNFASASADASGGAIYNSNNGTQSFNEMTVTATTFTSNHSLSPVGTNTTSGGGAIYDGAGAKVLASVFTANVATNGGGGAIMNNGDGLDVRGSTFTGNVANGGQLSNGNGEGFGGALNLFDASTITASTFQRNHAQQGGGAIYSDDANEITGLLIRANSASEGGALWLDWLVAGSRNAIIDNTATMSGGGIFVHSKPLNGAFLTGSVIAGNVAPAGPGLQVGELSSYSGSGVFSDSSITGNHTPGGAPRECGFSSVQGAPPGSGQFGNVIGDASCQFGGGADRIGAAQQGYWFGAAAGVVKGVNAPSLGGVRGISAIAAGLGNQGYWVLAKSGAVHGFGAPSYGSATGRLAGGTAVAIVPTVDHLGYWVAGSTGAVAAFGDAKSFGQHLGLHVVAMARSIDSNGYLLVTSDGHVVAFGDATSFGAHAGITAAGIAMTPDGQGYWITSTTGHVFNFGDAKPYGSSAVAGVIGIASSPNGRGYLLFTSAGKALPHGNAHASGHVTGSFTAVAAT